MARDLEVAEQVQEDGAPRLRLYGWRRPTLSLGYAQDASPFDRERLSALGVDLVRRPTGGRAVLHQHEVTYAFAVLQREMPGDVRSTYLEIAQALVEALRALGAAVDLAGAPAPSAADANCFAQPSWYEIELGGRKLLGSAQVRRGGVLLQHGALPLDLDYGLWAAVFAPQAQEEYMRAMQGRAIGLQEAVGRTVAPRAARDAIASAFSRWWAARVNKGGSGC